MKLNIFLFLFPEDELLVYKYAVFLTVLLLHLTAWWSAMQHRQDANFVMIIRSFARLG